MTRRVRQANLTRPPACAVAVRAPLLAQDEPPNPTVELADQQLINRFGRLNDLVEGMRVHEARLRTELENLDDAADELMLADDSERVTYFVGGAFYELPHSDAEARLERDKSALADELSELETNIEANSKELAELKVTLKSKFKVNQNLKIATCCWRREGRLCLFVLAFVSFAFYFSFFFLSFCFFSCLFD